MSPVSRGRKGKRNKRSTRQSPLPYVLGAPDECDCPWCSGADFDPQLLIDGMIACGAADLAESEDPLDAEIVGATMLSIGARAGEGFEEALVGGFIPEFEARASSEALAMLLAIGSVAEDRADKAASVAAGRLVDAGVPRQGWAAELREPVTVADCWRLIDSHGTASVLTCTFHRAGRSHAVVIGVDHEDCGAASDILLLDVDQLPEALQMMRSSGRDNGVEITTEALDPAEFRWQVEKALAARAVHDSDVPDEGLDAILGGAEDGVGYQTLAVLVRARMNTLPTPSKRAAPHGDEDEGRARLTALQMLAELAADAGSPFGARTQNAARGRTTVATRPTKRKKAGRPAPADQIKVVAVR